MVSVPGQAVNRHCAGSLTAVANAAAQIGSGVETGDRRRRSAVAVDESADERRIPGPTLEFEERWIPPTHVEAPDAPTRDMSITVGWNTAQAVGISREEMDAWALAVAPTRHRCDRQRRLRRRDRPAENSGPRRCAGGVQRGRTPPPRDQHGEAGIAEGATPGDRGVFHHRRQQQRDERRGRRADAGRRGLRPVCRAHGAGLGQDVGLGRR